MHVYLLPRRDGKYFIHARSAEARRREPLAEDTSAARKLWELGKKGYERLTRDRSRREALLRSLGEVQRVRILFPAKLTEAGARRVYDGLIEEQTAKHKKWLVVNAAALPVSVPLSLIPGPNVVLAYLAWRTMTHYQTKKAGEKASGLRIDFVANETLDELTRLVHRGSWFRYRKRIRKLGEKLGLDRLDRVY